MFFKGVLFVIMVTSVICEQDVHEQVRQRIHNYAERECTKNNAKEKTREIEEASMTFVDCMLNSVDVNIMLALEQASSENDIVNAYKKTCVNIPQIRNCLYNFMNGTAPCMKSEYRNEIGTAMKEFDGIFEYMCGNDSQRFTEFVADGGLNCLNENSIPIGGCARAIAISLDSSSAENSSEELKTSCEELQRFQKCFHEVLVKCPKPSTTAYFDGLLDLIRKYSECSNSV